MKKTLNDWKDDNSCATYMQRYIHDATLHDVYLQHGLYFEREKLRKKEKRKVLTLGEDGNVKSITRKQMVSEIKNIF